MSNVIVTELIVDARGAEAGSARHQRAMQAAQAAVDRMIDREERLAVASEKASIAMTGGATSVARVAAQYQRLAAAADPAIAAGQKIAAAQIQIDAAVRRGVTTQTEASRILELYASRMNGSAQAARELQREQEALARQDVGNIALVQRHLENIAREAATLTRTYDPLIAAQERYNQSVDQANRLARQSLISEETRRTAIAASQRALEAAGAPRGDRTSNVQRGLDLASSVRHSGLSARDSASVFEADARAMDAMTASAARLRAEIDPLGAAQARLTVELASYQEMASRQVITTDEMAVFSGRAREEFEKTASALKPVEGGIKLTNHQVTNLGYQLNDVATMLAMGASPFAIISSQSGQVVQALGDGPGGVRGSLQAIGTAAKAGALAAAAAIGPLGFAFIGVTAAAAAFAFVMRDRIPDATATMEDHSRILDQVAKRYDGIAEVLAQIDRRATIGIEIELGANTDDLREIMQSQIRQLEREFIGAGGWLGTSAYGTSDTASIPALPEFEPIRQMVEDFRAELRAGEPDVEAFMRSLKVAYAAAGDDTEMRRAIETAQNLVKALAGTALALDKNAAAADGSAQALARYNSAMSTLASLAPDLRTNAERINDAFREAMANSQSIWEDRAAIEDRNRGLAADTAGALDRLADARAGRAAIGLSDEAKAIADVNRQYQLSIRAYRGNADAIEALTEARDIEIATIREQSAFDLGQKAREEAEDYRQASTDRLDGIRQTVDALEMERSLLGRSEGDIAAARFAYQALAEAKRAAAEAGMAVSPAEVAAIQEAAASIGALTTQINAMREAQAQAERVAETIADLQFQGSLFGLSDTDREIATTLNGLKVSYESLDGQRIAGQMRYNASLEETQNALEKQRQLVENVASTFLDIFTDSSSDSFFDRILKGLGDISRQFADLGKQRLLDMFTGGSVGYTSGFPAPGQRTVAPIGVPLAANQNSPAGISVGAVTALNDNLRQSSRSAMDVAKQFDGLNERADSRVLDSFMQASGTWRNLSARDTAWCAAFANAALVESGQRGTGSNLASSFMGWGQGTNAPKPGDIVVLRPQARGASGHVGFFDGFDDRGNVRVFGGNQSNAANTRTFAASEVRSFRTAVAGGVIDAQRAMATGQAGIVASGPSMSGAASQAMAGGWGGFGPVAGQGSAQLGLLGRAQQFMQSPLGMGGMNAFSAFGAGMSSGSPVSGGFSGALGAIGMGLGPVGIIAGGLAGIVGGLFGRSRQRRAERRQREEQERQQRLQAQQQLEQQLPAILELQDTLLDRASGTLVKEKARIESQIKQYQTLAKTAKNQTEIDRLNSMADSLNDYMERQYDQLRLTASSVIQSLAAGRGLEPEFAKSVSAVREQSLTIRNYIADLTAATGAGSGEVQAATSAGREQLLRMLSGAEEVTEIWTRLDALTGTASQLSTELQKLGMSAEDAGRAVSDHLGRGIQKMRDEFVRGIADETAEGMGLGYLPQLRSLMERRETMRADATSLGADPTLIDRWFGVQARNILDQAGLLDKEIAPLVKAFPDLANVLGDASAKIERSLADAENGLRTAYQRVRQFADQLAAFRDDIKLDRNLSTLGPEERLLEAQKQFRAVAEKAAAGDAEAQGELINLSRSYLDEAKAFYTSSEAYYAIFREVDGTLKSTEAKAVAELDLAKSQYGALLSLNESVLTIPQALAAMDAAQAARDLAQGQALQAYVQALNPQAAIPSYQAPGPVTGNPAPAPAPAPAGPALVNQTMWNGSSYSNYVGSWTTLTDRGLISFIGSDRLFVPTGMDQASALILANTNQAGPSKGGPVFNWDAKRLGGEIGRGYGGLGYQAGGVVANGTWDVDSVFARHRDGGAVWLAGGEGILNAHAMRLPGVPAIMEAANAGRLPDLRLPQVSMSAAPTMRSHDNRELVAEVRALRAEVSGVRQAVGLGAVETVGAVERGTRVAQERAMEAKRQRAAA